ncbi:hypothetical protein ACTMTF_45975 [Nonomuraea sp. ZG12]|uniref:hypothetical protein n=1 Tax=Nonomuraea sp. ZG12 TaxID=3452207 RepID=UPI003F8B90DF
MAGTMSGPAWWPQPSAPEGASAAEGIRKQLGRPDMDPLRVLVREAAQNTWDARLDSVAEVGFDIGLTRPGISGMAPWRDALLPAFCDDKSLGLSAVLHDPDAVVLTISDRGTGGLGGPLRGDYVHEGSADFVGLVRDIGRPSRRAHSGGTYGFGKGVLFTTSAAGTILVRTRCLWQGRVQTRLIVPALGASFDHDGRLYTGRHWWGRTAIDGIPDPLIDDEADAVAETLGLPTRGPNELGTDIVILGATLGSNPPMEPEEPERPRTLADAANFIGSAMLWELWPVMIDVSESGGRMRCRVAVDGHELDLPRAESVPRLQPFVRAYRTARTDGESLRSRNPTVTLGRFALEAFMTPVRTHWTDIAAPADGSMHHCALMRQAGLVVQYRPGPRILDNDISYGAIFQTDVGVDDVFASAEPPTHDAWVHKNMEDPAGRKLVQSALRTVDNRMRDYVHADSQRSVDADRQPPLGALSNRFSSLLPTGSGQGADPSSSGSNGGGGGNGDALVRTHTSQLVEMDGDFYVVTDIAVAATTSTIRVTATAFVALDTGSETEPPAGSSIPEVLYYLAGDGSETHGGAVLTLKANDRRGWRVVVRPVVGTATRIRISGEYAQGEVNDGS